MRLIIRMVDSGCVRDSDTSVRATGQPESVCGKRNLEKARVVLVNFNPFKVTQDLLGNARPLGIVSRNWRRI